MNTHGLMHFLCLLLAALFLISSVDAEIGATPEQSMARYGKPERDELKNSGLLFFCKEGLCTIAHFYQGACDVLSIFSTSEMQGVAEELDYGKRASLLKSEGGGAAWMPIGRVSINEVWNSSDKKSFAIYDTMRHKLVIMTRAAYAREKEAKKEALASQKKSPQ